MRLKTKCKGLANFEKFSFSGKFIDPTKIAVKKCWKVESGSPVLSPVLSGRVVLIRRSTYLHQVLFQSLCQRQLLLCYRPHNSILYAG